MNAPPTFNIDLIRDTSNTNNERPKWIQTQKLKTMALFWCPLFAFMTGHLNPKPPECQGRVLLHYYLPYVGYRFGHRGELLFYRSTVRMCDVHTAYQVVKSLRKAMTHHKIHRSMCVSNWQTAVQPMYFPRTNSRRRLLLQWKNTSGFGRFLCEKLMANVENTWKGSRKKNPTG